MTYRPPLPLRIRWASWLALAAHDAERMDTWVRRHLQPADVFPERDIVVDRAGRTLTYWQIVENDPSRPLLRPAQGYVPTLKRCAWPIGHQPPMDLLQKLNERGAITCPHTMDSGAKGLYWQCRRHVDLSGRHRGRHADRNSHHPAWPNNDQAPAPGEDVVELYAPARNTVTFHNQVDALNRWCIANHLDGSKISGDRGITVDIGARTIRYWAVTASDHRAKDPITSYDHGWFQHQAPLLVDPTPDLYGEPTTPAPTGDTAMPDIRSTSQTAAETPGMDVLLGFVRESTDGTPADRNDLCTDLNGWVTGSTKPADDDLTRTYQSMLDAALSTAAVSQHPGLTAATARHAATVARGHVYGLILFRRVITRVAWHVAGEKWAASHEETAS